ncbi:MAG: hypothetical protein J0652_07120 [Desulfobulbaceae bacterium]|jgi:hypothetical protein|nr:hypothetical protein [Desulfobulbaceae bacterium]
MNETNEQKLCMAIGTINLVECFLDKEGLTKKEIEFLQQALGGAASLLTGVVNSSPPAHMTT